MKKAKAFLKNFDQFGHPVTLQFKKDSSFRTPFGGFLSLLMMLGLFVWFIILMRETINREKFTIVNSILRRDPNLESNSIILNRTNFDLAFTPFYINQAFPEEKKKRIHEYIIFRLQFSDFQLISDPAEIKRLGTNYQYTLTNIPLVTCTKDRFLNMTKAAQSFGIVGAFYCLDPNFNFNLTGSWSSANLKYFTLTASICEDVKTSFNLTHKCAPRNESIDVTKDIALRVAILTQNFAADDFESETPIKNQINYDTYIGLHPTIQNFGNYKISRNFVELGDNWFSDMLPTVSKEYIDLRYVGNSNSYFTQNSYLPYLSMANFLIDEQSSYYTRQVGTLSDVFGNIGGIMGIITVIVGFVLGWVQEQQYAASLIRKLILINNSGQITSQSQYEEKTNSTVSKFKQQLSKPIFTLFRDQIFPGLFNPSRKKLYEEASDSLDKQLDIVTLLRHLNLNSNVSKALTFQSPFKKYLKRQIIYDKSADQQEVIKQKQLNEEEPNHEFEQILNNRLIKIVFNPKIKLKKNHKALLPTQNPIEDQSIQERQLVRDFSNDNQRWIDLSFVIDNEEEQEQKQFPKFTHNQLKINPLGET